MYINDRWMDGRYACISLVLFVQVRLNVTLSPLLCVMSGFRLLYRFPCTAGGNFSDGG